MENFAEMLELLDFLMKICNNNHAAFLAVQILDRSGLNLFCMYMEKPIVEVRQHQ